MTEHPNQDKMSTNEKLVKATNDLCDKFKATAGKGDPAWNKWVEESCEKLIDISCCSPTCPPSCGPPD